MAVIKKVYENKHVKLDTTRGRSKFSITVHGLEAVQLHVVERQLADGIPVERPGCYFNYQKSPCQTKNQKVWDMVFEIAKEFYRDNDLEFRGSTTYEGPIDYQSDHRLLARMYHLPPTAQGKYVVCADTSDMVHLLTVDEKEQMYEHGFLKSVICRDDVTFVPQKEVGLEYITFDKYNSGINDVSGCVSLIVNSYDSCENMKVDVGNTTSWLTVNLFLAKRLMKTDDMTLIFPEAVSSLGLKNSSVVTLSLGISGDNNLSKIGLDLKTRSDIRYRLNMSFSDNIKGIYNLLKRSVNQLSDDSIINGSFVRKSMMEKFKVSYKKETSFDRKDFSVKRVKEAIELIDRRIKWKKFSAEFSDLAGDARTKDEVDRIKAITEKRLATIKEREKERKRKVVEYHVADRDWNDKYDQWLEENYKEKCECAFWKNANAPGLSKSQKSRYKQKRKDFRQQMRSTFIKATGLKEPKFPYTRIT